MPKPVKQQQVDMIVFGKKFDVLVGDHDSFFIAGCASNKMAVFGHSQEHALANMHYAVTCLATIEEKIAHC